MTVRKILPFILLLCFSLNLVGCDFLNKNDAGKGNKDIEKITFKVYRPDQNGEWLIAEEYEQEIKKDEQPLAIALQTLLSQKPKDEKLMAVFPEGVKLLDVKIIGDLAEINLSKELLEKNIGGSLNEMLIVSSIVNTATEFPEVKNVQLLVEGKKVETIAGHMDVLDTLKRNESIIKKN